MRDVWLILFAAAAMLTVVPALKRLDAYIAARMEREEEENEQAPDADETAEAANPEK